MQFSNTSCMFRVESLRIIPKENASAKDSQTGKDRTKQAAFVKAASNLADDSAKTHCRLSGGRG